jgi:AraC-like DNA-binding protein
MTLEKFTPCALLQPYIKGYLIIESEEGMVNTILPDTSIIMAFRFRGKVGYSKDNEQGALPRSVISGLRKSALTVTYSQKTSNLLVIFKEAAASAFFKEPMHELFSQSVSLDCIIQRSLVNKIEEQLEESHDHLQCIAIVEHFLISRLHEPKQDLFIQKAVQSIQLSKGDIRINEFMAGIPLSRDAFEKRFRKATGTTPKRFSSIIRLTTLIDSLHPDSSLTDVALTAGYFDQSHFIKDFRAFTGVLPHDFIKQPKRW